VGWSAGEEREAWVYAAGAGVRARTHGTAEEARGEAGAEARGGGRGVRAWVHGAADGGDSVLRWINIERWKTRVTD
jgi:hypothetical protein